MDLDVTLFFQLALLAALMVLLNRLLFAPLLAVIEKRHQKIHGTRAEVERLERLSVADRAAYETRIRQTRREAAGVRENLRRTGRDEARKVIVEARAHIAKAMNETREEVGANERAAQQALQSDVDSLAQQLTAKLLARKAAG